MIEDELRAYNFIEKRNKSIIQQTETSEKQKSTYENENKVNWMTCLNNFNFTYSACNLIVYELK